MAKSKPQDAACERDDDGVVSNSLLHQELVEGVNDHDFCLQDRAQLIANGLPEDIARSLIPG